MSTDDGDVVVLHAQKATFSQRNMKESCLQHDWTGCVSLARSSDGKKLAIRLVQQRFILIGSIIGSIIGHNKEVPETLSLHAPAFHGGLSYNTASRT